MERFLEDYPGPGISAPYRAAGLPRLPYEDGTFDLALVSHLLFTYSDHLGAGRAILCRIWSSIGEAVARPAVLRADIDNASRFIPIISQVCL